MSETQLEINGKWHYSGSAAQLDAALIADDSSYVIKIADAKTVSGSLSDISIGERLGNVERKLTFADGSIFVTNDNDGIDRLSTTGNAFNSLLHSFESNIAWVAVALILTIVTSGAFFKWGIPWTSSKIAHALPHKTNELIAGHTLEFLDDYFFEGNSDTDLDTATKIRKIFQNTLVPLERNHQDIEYQLHFRKWEVGDKGIPNALALPSGDIILTDKFIELSESQDEINAVLLHEMGHVVRRHTLEMVIEATLLTTIIMVATGDSNGLSDMGIGLGSLLVSSHYSRGHESEADIYAFEKMLEAKIDPQAFSNIMERMNKYMEESEGQIEQDVSIDKDSKSTVLDYIASHPNTATRIAQANHYSKCFHNGLAICPPLIPE